MRTFFLLLLLANVAFFGYRYYVAQQLTRHSSPSAQQVDPERIRIVTADQYARIVASRRGAGCIELGPLAVNEATRAEEAVAGLADGLKVSARRAEEPSRWWVYIPPLSTRQAALQREAELKKQGVEDSSVIADDPSYRFAISLGVFRSEDAANNRAEALRKRGVRGIAVAPRDAPGMRVYVQLRDAPEPVRMKLFELRPSFPGSEVRECQGS